MRTQFIALHDAQVCLRSVTELSCAALNMISFRG